jgi:tRNA-splicing endonuclease subunit Sen34
MASQEPVSEPFPIFKLAHRYLLYDVNTISHIRAKYNITGVLIGQLPQAPQQNVFSGIPLELMPEEARLLVEKGVAHIVDDVKAHKQGFMGNGLGVEETRAYKESLRRQGAAAAKQAEKKAEDRSKAALGKKLGGENWNDIPDDMFRPGSRASNTNKKKRGRSAAPSGSSTPAAEVAEESLFGSSGDAKAPLSRTATTASTAGPPAYAVTPTTSYPPLSANTPPPSHPHQNGDAGATPDLAGSALEGDMIPSELPDVPSSYPLFKHLHEKDYFLAPGLRFGCQYMAYPGDPLRFHSHFLCNGMAWDQEFDLLDLVGGGRLGTGVKKGFLIGGEEKKADAESKLANVEGADDGGDAIDGEERDVRAFCVEWAGM